MILGRRDVLRTTLLGGGALATTGFGAALLRITERPAAAQAPTEIQMLQTAASIENVASFVYNEMLRSPFFGATPPVVKTFIITTKLQHVEHAKAFNGRLTLLQGRQQQQLDPELVKVYNEKRPGFGSIVDMLDLAILLETAAAQTYVKSCELLDDLESRKIVASIMGVEAQHVAVLDSVRLLLGPGLIDQLNAFPRMDLGTFPAEAGSLGSPAGFYATSEARPGDEGVVR